MRTDYETLEEISAFIDSKGFKYIEKLFEYKLRDNNTLGRIMGNPFNDGECVGIVRGIGICRREIDLIRQDIKQMQEEKKHENNNR